jgi:hypothetical protein
MNHPKLCAFAALFVVATGTPALAQSNQSNASGANAINASPPSNQSNASGANAINAPGFSGTPGSGRIGYGRDVLNQAQQLASELTAAQQAYQAAQQQSEQGTRRFTRRRKCNCTNPEQANLEAAQTRVDEFIDRIKNPTPALLQSQPTRSTQSW